MVTPFTPITLATDRERKRPRTTTTEVGSAIRPVGLLYGRRMSDNDSEVDPPLVAADMHLSVARALELAVHAAGCPP